MVYLSLSLLGSFQAWTAKGSQIAFRTLKERALLAYLAVEHGRPHDRNALAELLWPERPEGSARNNLRQALFGIRQVIGEEAYTASFSVRTTEVQFNLGESFWLDLTAFDMHIRAAQLHDHPPDSPCLFCIQHLANAVEIYRGDFLQDVYLDDNQEFQEWITIRREQYFQRQVEALDNLVSAYEKMGAFGQAAVYAMRQVQLDDLKENLYRRLMVLLAKTGRHGAAVEQYEICKHKLLTVLGIEPDEETSRLAGQIRSGRFDARERETIPVTHNLPQQLTPFIGREMEQAMIAQCLVQPAARLITLTGPGGVGKTRLALQAALSNLRIFPDGVFFVPLEAVHAVDGTNDRLPEAIGQAIGLAPGRQQDFRAALLDALRSKKMLLVLDNFEHLLDGKDLLVDILKADQSIKILVTSRERLHFQAEQVISLNGLSFPEAAPAMVQQESPQRAEAVWQKQVDSWQFEAVRLFLERAGRMRDVYGEAAVFSGGHAAPHALSPLPEARTMAWDALGPDDRAAVIRICKAVDGLPLAIELAASWARDFSLPQIADEVQNSLDFLQASLQDLPERHRSLRASFEHSWDLLLESEREIFSKLAVFPSSFSVTAAQAVAGAALPWLIALEDKSLVRRVNLGRYSLHTLIRQYAGQKLLQYPRKINVQARYQHALFFCNYLKARELDLKGRRQADALEEIDAEMENIRIAWDWAVEHQSVHLFKMAGFSLMLFFEFRSRWREGEDFFTRAANSLEATPVELEEKHVLAYLMAFQGWFSARLTRFQLALDLLTTSSQQLEGANVSNETAFAHFALGFLGAWMNRFEEALFHLNISLQMAESSGNQWGVGWARQLLNEIAFESGSLGLDETPFQSTLALFKRNGEIRGSSRALNYLGNIAIAQGRLADARTYFETMTGHLEKIGDVWGAASGYGKLGQVAALMGDPQRALTLSQVGLEMLRKTGDQRRTAIALGELGELAVTLGNAEQSEVCFLEAFQIVMTTHSLPLAQDLLISAASALLKCNQQDRAAALIQVVLAQPVMDRLTSKQAYELLQKVTLSGSYRPLVDVDQRDTEKLIWENIENLLENGIKIRLKH